MKLNLENQKVYETIVALLEKRKISQYESANTENVILKVTRDSTVKIIDRMLFADINDAI